MNPVEGSKGKYNRKVTGSTLKFESNDRPVESSVRRKPRMRQEMLNYNRMEKHYSTTMADQIPAYTPADDYKPRKQALMGKSASMYSQAMSNDDLYRLIHNSSGTRPETSVDNLVARKDTRRHRMTQGPLSLIADEDEEEEVSDSEYIYESKGKPFEDDEADDEIDYESDQYGADGPDQVKEYRRFPPKSTEADDLKQQYLEWLKRRNPRPSREIDEPRTLKYERSNRGKSRCKPMEEPPEQRKHPEIYKCSECRKKLETSMKTASRGRATYDYPEFARDFQDKPPKFQDPNDDMRPCPKPRKSANISRHRESRKMISHSPSKINYYDE
ncbi:uncharacterized protein [Fopius arisanus]|uniref:Uncharacterized protein n=1 Tax=Fopius arisanus TaxID=64838 RepID=A0A0C9RM08_9HYME|nr:PREDICTED: uncharacterized protein LOC105265912 [Fopius arisanus]